MTCPRCGSKNVQEIWLFMEYREINIDCMYAWIMANNP